MEFADFPGERSQEAAEERWRARDRIFEEGSREASGEGWQPSDRIFDERSQKNTSEGEWLHRNSFFRWMLDANALIFVVDLAPYLGSDDSRDYVARMTKAIRATWQHLREADGNSDAPPVEERPTVLVFAKADLFGITTEPNPSSKTQELIASLGLGERVPQVQDIDEAAFAVGKEKALADFRDIVSFLESQTSRFTVVFTSCFGRANGQLLGLREVLNGVVPRRTLGLFPTRQAGRRGEAPPEWSSRKRPGTARGPRGPRGTGT